jgi:two-component system chemotaxis response regulator CheB
MAKIRVLIVDDSAAVRTTLSEIIAADPDLEVMATASDPYVAVERIRHEVPDVIFLDVEMPRMDGLTFLRKLMSQRPIPVVICSSLAEAGSDTLMQLLEAGAVDVVAKPRVDTSQFLIESSMRICDAARAAAHAKLKGISKPAPQLRVEAKLTADAVLPPLSAARAASLRASMPVTEPIIAIGASTGGTEALRELL